MPDRAFTLTPDQRLPVESWGAREVCVVAGPGSGKTRVLVERIRWLVVDKGVDPRRILAITFTRKASHSMYARLFERAGGDHELRRKLAAVHISTIHAFCQRLLGENALAAGLDPDARLLEPVEAQLLVAEAVEAALEAAYASEPKLALRFLHAFKGAFDLPDGGEASRIHAQIRNVIDSIRCSGADLPAAPAPPELEAEQRWIEDALRRSLEAYGEAKRREPALDFNDLELEALRLLVGGASLRADYQHVLIDENQDTNPLETQLVEALVERLRERGPTLFVVGDPNQSIYGFRHADLSAFRQFRQQAQTRGGKVFELYENFRSRPDILTVVEALTKRAPGVETRQLRAKREFPPKQQPSVEILVARAQDRGDACRREEDWLAARLTELKRELRLGAAAREPSWRDFAILLRTNQLLSRFAAALERAGIPYQLNAGRGFFESEEVRDLLRLLRAIDDPRDEVSLATVLRSPLCGVADETLLRLKLSGRSLVSGLRQPPSLPAGEAARLAAFRERFERFRSEREDAPYDVLLSRLVAAFGYGAWLLAQPGGLQRAANLDKLAAIADRIGGGGSFHQLVRRLEEMQLTGPLEGEASAPEDAADAVHLMTVHAAKGLEFPVVFLPALDSAGKSDTDPLLFVPGRGLAVRWTKPETGEDLPVGLFPEARAQRKKREAEEANRLLYVAATRAEEHLILSASWGSRVIRTGWSKLLAENLKVAVDKLDERPSTVELGGVAVRLFRTDQEPPAVRESAAQEAVSAALVSPIHATGRADSEASVTSVALFAVCPRRYYLSRYLGLEEAERPDEEEVAERPGARRLGLRVHELLAGHGSPHDGDEARLVEQFRSSDIGRRAAQAPESFRERSVVFAVDGRLLRGQIDLYFADAQGGCLIDYKTDRLGRGELAQKAAEYAAQLQIYALAVDAEKRRLDRALLYFLEAGEAIEVDISAPALDRARKLTRDFFAAQERQDFPLRPGDRCWRCPHFRGACPAKPQVEADARGQLRLAL